jgi:heterodisulfide reductase subunit C
MTTAAQALVPSPVVLDGFLQEVEAASGARAVLCFQCQKCTSGCPVAARADIKPHELIRLIQLGERDEVLSSRMIWECTSCQTCWTRCPQAVDLPAMIDALRRLSRATGKVTPETAVPVFNDIFLGAVRQMGRVYELGLMAAFKLRTRSLRQDFDKLPAMLRKGKLALLPAWVRGRSERARLFRRAQELGNEKR